MKIFDCRNYILIVSILCEVFICNAKVGRVVDANTLAEKLMYQVWSFPQEKVYVFTDRNAYLSGDSIRFRAFLVDATSHMRQTNSSKFVYVELLDPFGNRVKTLKIKETDGIFAGILPLDQEMPEGNYTICAYTQFMQNIDKDYYYRKRVPVYSQLSGKYRLDAECDSEYITMRLTDRNSGLPVKADNISMTDKEDHFYIHKIRNRSSYSTRITKEMVKAGHVKVKFDKYEKYVAIPGDTASMALTFHPEGGYLIPDKLNRLAFKALDKKGISKDFKGVIVDEDGDTVEYIQSTHKGMGMTMFTPESGKDYRAVVNDVYYPLPSSNSRASVLNIERINPDSILIKAIGNIKNGMSLLAHTGGVVSLAKAMKEEEMVIDCNKLGSGIVQFLLVDDTGTILSSRMMFNKRGYIYDDSLDSLPQGDYSVRAFRDRGFIADSTSSIVSDMLLQSELKGHIEDPDYYFRNNDSITDANLDLLMLTQGWERYDFAKALRDRYTEPKVPMEIGGEITGTVRSRWMSRPLSNAVVMLISPQLDYASQTLTDENGRYVFNGMDWPEDTAFIMQVFGKSGDKEHNYTIDKDVFPNIDPIENRVDYNIDNDFVAEGLLTAGTIMLDELEVSAPLSPEESRREMLAALGVKTFTSEEFDKLHITTYEEVLRKIPGLRIVNGNVISSFAKGTYNTGQSGSNVEFWIDGVRWTPSSSSSGSLARSNAPTLMNAPLAPEHTYREHMDNSLGEFSAIYPFHIVESIEYFRPSTAMIISKEAAMGGGALVITTKDGSKIKEWDADLFVKAFRPLGYQNLVESYQPYYLYDLTADDGSFNAAWLPKVTNYESLPLQNDIYIEIEGFAEGGVPLVIRTYK